MNLSRLRSFPRAVKLESLELRRLLSADARIVGESVHRTDDDGLSIGFFPQTTVLQERGGFVTGKQAGRRADLARSFFADRAGDFGLTAGDAAQLAITNQYADADTGVTHVYLQQTLGGLPIQNAVGAIHFMSDGRVINASSSFVPGVADASARLGAPNISKMIHPINALRAAANELDVAFPAQSPTFEFVGGKELKFDAQSAALSLDSIPIQAQYVATGDGIRLAWKAVLRLPNHSGDWYDVSVDATNGKVLLATNWTDHLASYNVLPIPVEAPHDGSRTIVTDPWDLAASPFGWHDTDGDIDPDFTDTRGNNVNAQEDTDANNSGGTRPSGGAAAPLDFNFTFDPGLAPSSNQSAAITNLFYWNNILHDIHYRYGFTEAAGSFQVNNYGNGGAGNDPVNADALDGSGTNNANFGTPPDGQSGRMQMYVWTAATPDRDSDFDNGVITHEYGHGVSNRLTGGPANSGALDATQSGGMGEGWSDFFALMFTQRATDTQNGSFGMATYLNNQPTTGNGIRVYPYSYNMTTDPITFDYYGTSGSVNGVNRSTEVHRAGTMWASALWDMNWLLINKYGFDGNLYTGYNASGTTAQRAGNKLALRLVEFAMTLQVANPTFADARDAILQADQVINGGLDTNEIWQAFARRGLGFSFYPGRNSSSSTVVPAFDLPSADPIVFGAYTQNLYVAPPASLAIRFSEPMSTSSFSVAEDVFGFTGPGGGDLANQITGFSWSANAQVLTISFNAQNAVGAYSMTIGPNILAADDGHALDQDRDGTPGETTDRYTANFTYTTLLGPDGAGYRAGQWAFENLNLAPGPGVTAIDTNGDDVTEAINMGTNSIRFYSTTYSSAANAVNASSNGFVCFGAVSTAAQNTDLTSPSAARIAGLWDDWITSRDAADQVLYRFDDLNADGTSDRLVVEWNDVPHFESTSDGVTFQIIIQLNTGTTPGTMIVNYVDVQTGDANFTSGASSTVGLKDTGTPPPNRLAVSVDDPAFPWIGNGKAIRFSPDWTPPTVASNFAFDSTTPRLTYQFSENVSASLAKGDLVLTNTTTDTTINPADMQLAYSAATNTATFTFPGLTGGVLPDGNYTATVAANSVTDASWMPLASDSVLNFFSFAGDANRDRSVNIGDFSILASRFNLPGTFSQGDFNYNGTVEIGDFSILASHFNTGLPAARSSAGGVVTSSAESRNVFAASPAIDEFGAFRRERVIDAVMPA